MAHPVIHEMWPALVVLEEHLQALTSGQHDISAPPSHAARSEDEMFERFVARLNRTGGPKISPRAIAQ